eukprot:CAMPEP_0169469210 /NCGR_PEP_ID=MMETSP1042-20121227/23349_1 /TAXON_ID=464988 /ORGANISM="Hemiselmis andersenii, Strain CCMP1180" /LENGTH=32 /DNA_ID= /DNA_START= /DNA_END= /DNA_ORIENTATION=
MASGTRDAKSGAPTDVGPGSSSNALITNAAAP